MHRAGPVRQQGRWRNAAIGAAKRIVKEDGGTRIERVGVNGVRREVKHWNARRRRERLASRYVAKASGTNHGRRGLRHSSRRFRSQIRCNVGCERSIVLVGVLGYILTRSVIHVDIKNTAPTWAGKVIIIISGVHREGV